MIIQNYTSCGCTPGTVNGGNIVPPDPCGVNCLYNPNLVVMCADSVAPGGSGQVDISTEHNGATFCATGFTYQLYAYDTTFFTSVTLVGADLSFTIAASAPPGTYGNVTVILACDDEIYKSQALVQICAKNLCANVICTPGNACDPADGICKAISDIEVS